MLAAGRHFSTAHAASYNEEKASFLWNHYYEPKQGCLDVGERNQPQWHGFQFRNVWETAIVVVTLLHVELELKSSSHHICRESFLREEILQGVFKNGETFGTFVMKIIPLGAVPLPSHSFWFINSCSALISQCLSFSDHSLRCSEE